MTSNDTESRRDPPVKSLGTIFSSLFTSTPRILSENERIHREWDRQRARAIGPSDQAEIDAIFSRSLV